MAQISLVVGIVLSNTTLNTNACSIEYNLHQHHKYCPYPGFAVEAIGNVLRRAQINYKTIQIPDSDLVRELLMQNHTIDLVASDLTYLTEQQFSRGYKYSTPFNLPQTRNALMAKQLSTILDVKGLSRYAQVFTPKVWLCFAFLYVAFRAYVYFTTFIIKSRHEQFFPVLLDFFAGLALAFYGNSLLANIIRPQVIKPVDSYEDILDALSFGNSQLQLVRDPTDKWIEDAVETGGGIQAIRRLTDMLDLYPAAEIVSGDERRELITDGKMMELVPQLLADWIAAETCEARGVLSVPIPELGNILTGIVFSPKTSVEVVRRINEAILQNYQEPQYLYGRYIDRINRLTKRKSCKECPCVVQKTIYDGHDRILLTGVLIVFTCLGACYLIALCVLLGEIGFSVCKVRIQARVRVILHELWQKNDNL